MPMVVKLHGFRIFEPDSLFPHWDLGKNPITDDLRFLVNSGKVALGSAALKLPHQFKPTSPLRLVPQPPPLRPMPLHPLAATLLVLMGAYEVYSNWRDSKTPAIDKPPEGKGVVQWIDDMKKFGLIAAEITTLQQQIRLMDEWGLGVWNYESKERLENLFAQAQTIAHDAGATVTSGALKMVASAEAQTTPPSAPDMSEDRVRKLLDERSIANLLDHVEDLDFYRGQMVRYMLSMGRSEPEILAFIHSMDDPLKSTIAVLFDTLGYPIRDVGGEYHHIVRNYTTSLMSQLPDDVLIGFVARHPKEKTIEGIALALHNKIDVVSDHSSTPIRHYHLMMDIVSFIVKGGPATLTVTPPHIQIDVRTAAAKPSPLEMEIIQGFCHDMGIVLDMQFKEDGSRRAVLTLPTPMVATSSSEALDVTTIGPVSGKPQFISQLIAPSANPTRDSIAAILSENPSTSDPNINQRTELLTFDASELPVGKVRYPRLEALVDHLVGENPSPTIIERGPGKYGHLAASVARKYPITLIEELKQVTPDLSGLSSEISANIQLVDVRDEPKTPTANLGIWIHPIPFLMQSDDKLLDLTFMGQDVVTGGYLVIQTEKNYIMPPSQEWELVYGGQHDGFLAPSGFARFTSNTIVLRRTADLLFTDWYELAETHPTEFAAQVRKVLSGFKVELTTRIALGKNRLDIREWYQESVLPIVNVISSAPMDDPLAQELKPWTKLIPSALEFGDVMKVRELLSNE